LILTSTLSLRCGRNLRIRLPTECPRYNRAGGVGATVHGSGVIEGADGTNRIGRGAPGGDMAVAPAVPTLRVPIGGVGAFNCARTGEESNRGTHRGYVSRVGGDDD